MSIPNADQPRATEQSAVKRAERAELKRMVANGNLDFAELIQQAAYGGGDHAAGRIPVGQALRAVNGIGPIKATRILADVGVAAKEHLATLNEAQREAIVAAVAEHA